MGGYRIAGPLVGGGGLLRQIMCAAMNVGIQQLVVVAAGVQDRSRFLRSGCVVKVDERLPMDLMPEDGKLGAQGTDIVTAHGRLELRRLRGKC